METMIERIDSYIKYRKISDNRFITLCGLSVGTLGQARRNKGDLSHKSVEKILATFPDLNRVWLLTGDGEMLNPTPTISNTNSQSNSPITGNNNNVGSTFNNSPIQSGDATTSELIAILREEQRQNADLQAHMKEMMKDMMEIIRNKQ